MSLRPLFPEIAPFETGLLPVGEGHVIAWEALGNPAGIPVVGLHGGPGSGRSARMRRFFDPARYRIVLFDQRGCGLSTPSAGDTDTDLATNTLPHLIDDLERLRDHLGIARWLVAGHSWGSTLGLAYAEAHPASVTGLLLIGVTMTRRREIDWLYAGLAPLFPAEWAAFRAGVPPAERGGDLVAAYARLLASPDPAVRARAARDFHAWDTVSVAGVAEAAAGTEAEARRRYGRARLVTHYFRHGAWLAEDQLLRDVERLADIPGILVHGRLDLQAPLETAWTLARAWPAAELVVVGEAGHATGSAAMIDAIVAATDRFADRLGQPGGDS